MMKENEKADDCFDPSLSACTWIRVSSLTVGYKPTTTRSAAKQKKTFFCLLDAKFQPKANETGARCLMTLGPSNAVSSAS